MHRPGSQKRAPVNSQDSQKDAHAGISLNVNAMMQKVLSLQIDLHLDTELIDVPIP